MAKKPATTVVSLDLPQTLYRQLAKLAQRRGCTLPEIMLRLMQSELRKQSGAARGQQLAMSRGVHIGRPSRLTERQKQKMCQLRQAGHRLEDIGISFGVSGATVSRVTFTQEKT